MKTLLVLSLLIVFSLTAAAEEPQSAGNVIIERVEISGIPEQRISVALRDELQKLEAQTYDEQTANKFADRIQAELPEFVAAARILPGTTPGQVRLVFAVARITDRDPLGANINARYTIESVEVEGSARTQIDDGLKTEMQAMVGKPLDNAALDKLGERIAGALGSQYSVDKRVVRGNPQHVKVIYDTYRIPLLPFRDPDSFLTYHPKQGRSFSIFVPIGFNDEFALAPVEPPQPKVPASSASPDSASVKKGGDNHVNFCSDSSCLTFFHGHSTKRLILGAANSGDDLVERYKGYRLGYEQVVVGTRHLGVKFEYTTFGITWKPQTDLASQASPSNPGLYRSRQTLEPSLAFAITPTLYATAGVRIVDLEMQSPSSGSRGANAGTGSLQYHQTVKSGKTTHIATAGYTVTAGSRTLDSDYVYTRHFWNGRYTFKHDKNMMTASLMGGRITGDAPLFDRFSLGNAETLRGWNKFDVAPLGGSRMVHGSLQWGVDPFQLFWDTGTVWNTGEPIRMRSSVGIGFGDEDGGFAGFGFRIRGAHLSPTVLLAIHF